MFKRVRTTVAYAFDAERLARVERLKVIVGNLKLFDPNELRGLSAKQVAEICRGMADPRVADGRGLGL